MRFAGSQLTNFMGDTMDYSRISGASMDGRSMERKAVMGAEAQVANAGIQSMGAVQSAGYRADAIRAGGQAQGQASMASGIGSMFSGLASGISSLGSRSSGISSYDYIPAFGMRGVEPKSYIGTGGRYGY